MCGYFAITAPHLSPTELHALTEVQSHRGPDGNGVHVDPERRAVLIHNRLSIIDLSSAGAQPMSTADGRLWIAFNGEVYNHVELRSSLKDYPFRSSTDTEVVLAAYERWGEACLHRLEGMFSFVIWNQHDASMFGARDRFGVKPLYYHSAADGSLVVATEIKALHKAGVPAEFNPVTWANYLTYGLYDNGPETFWQHVHSLPPGHLFRWCDGSFEMDAWYELADQIDHAPDERPVDQVAEEYAELLTQAVRLRFRSDVPVGVNISGGVDSSALLAAIHRDFGGRSLKAFTFVTGDDRYDELPWVRQTLSGSEVESVVCRLSPTQVPHLAEDIQYHQDEPFGGIPTIAYARIFEVARSEGVLVLLDGQGMDEQWAGYDYYARSLGTNGAANDRLVQGTTERATRTECLVPDFFRAARPLVPNRPFPDQLRNLQYRDTRYTKIPRALRFNDRISMRSSTELREPFLDHRLFELAFRQPTERKIQGTQGKWLLRQIVQQMLPTGKGITEAPKRPLQTPQREWLRGPLRGWANELVELAIERYGGTWLESASVREAWQHYRSAASDNSFYVWQWISLGLCSELLARRTEPKPRTALVGKQEPIATITTRNRETQRGVRQIPS